MHFKNFEPNYFGCVSSGVCVCVSTFVSVCVCSGVFGCLSTRYRDHMPTLTVIFGFLARWTSELQANHPVNICLTLRL